MKKIAEREKISFDINWKNCHFLPGLKEIFEKYVKVTRTETFKKSLSSYRVIFFSFIYEVDLRN